MTPSLTQLSTTPWQEGQWAIYRKSKRSTSPGPRASDVQGASKGDTYNYVVDKFWVVEDVESDEGCVRLRTATGKRHRIPVDDPNLRHPTWLQRLVWRNRWQRAERG